MSRIPLCALAMMCTIAVGVAAEPHQRVVTAAGQQATSADYEASVTPVSGYIDDSERYAPCAERWCLGIKDCIRATRLRGYKRLQKKHRDLLYPECPPYCSPTYGYHTTRWRQFPEQYEYIDPYAPGQVIYESPGQVQPMMLPLMPTPEYAPPGGVPSLAPPAAEPYFPGSGSTQPSDPGPAPAAPSADPTAPPAPPEPDLDSTGATYLPPPAFDGGATEPAAFEEPGLLPVN